MHNQIIIVEDDWVLGEKIAELLMLKGFRVRTAGSIAEFEALFTNSAASLQEAAGDSVYILDVNLPDGSGFDLCKGIRTRFPDAMILMLTVLDDEDSIVFGLECGADDYVTKPFSARVLESRIKALLRRRNDETKNILHSGDLSIDLEHGRAYCADIDLDLLPKELKIVSVLLHSRCCLVSRNALLEKIWDMNENFIDDNTLSVHMCRLRRKLGRFQGESYIVTERGFGYRWGVKIEKN